MILSEAARDEIIEVTRKYPSICSAILPALHIANREQGHLNDQIYREIAELLDLKLVDIAAVASFYTLFPKRKVGKYYIQVCRNLSCALLGARHLTEYLLTKFGTKLGETSADGLFTVVEVECLASCTTAPMMQINEKYYENLTREKVDQIIEELKRSA